MAAPRRSSAAPQGGLTDKLDEATALLRKLNFDARGPLAWMNKRGPGSANENLLRSNSRINQDLGAKDYTAAARMMMKKMESISDDAITADVNETRALLKTMSTFQHGIDVISDKLEREEVQKAFDEIKKELQRNSGYTQRVSKFMEDKLPDLVGIATSITGNPLAGTILSWTIKGVQNALMKGDEKSQQTKLVRELLDATKDSRTAQDATLVEAQRTSSLLERALPTPEEKADEARYKELMLKNHGFKFPEAASSVERAANDEGSFDMGHLLLAALSGGGMGGVLAGLASTVFGGLGRFALVAIKKVPIVAIVGSFIKSLFDMGGKIQSGADISDVLMTGLNSFADSMIRIFTFNLLNLEKVTDSDLVQRLGDFVFGGIEGFFELMKMPFQSLDNLVDSVMTRGQAYLEAEFGAFADFFQNMTWKGFLTLLTTSTDNLVAMFTGIWSDITGFAEQKFNEFKDRIKKMFGISDEQQKTQAANEAKYGWWGARWQEGKEAVRNLMPGSPVRASSTDSTAAAAAAASRTTSPVKAGSADQQAIAFFKSKGWTHEQAAGIAANLHHESGFKPTASGDSGRAYGIAQWHPDRQAMFAKQFGKSIKDSTLQEQLAFVDWELRNTEKGAGNKLRTATSAEQAGALVSKYYERPLATNAEMIKRGATAASLSRVAAQATPAGVVAAPPTTNVTQVNTQNKPTTVVAPRPVASNQDPSWQNGYGLARGNL